MKQQIILWISAVVITIIFIFLLRMSDPQKPVTGTLEFGGEKVGFKFDKVYRGDDDYKLIILSELQGLEGTIQYKDKDTGGNWTFSPLKYEEKVLTGYVPAHKSQSRVIYRAELQYKGESILIPSKEGVELEFLGRVSPQIMFWYYAALFIGILLSTRIGLEYFNENEKIKKLCFFAFIMFVFYSMLLVPVKITYELSAFEKSIPHINQLFPLGSVILILLWIGGIISFFNLKNRKLAALLVSILTMIVLLVFRT